MSMEQNRGWIAVDLDGTLAKYDGWKGVLHIGAPIPAMVERIKRWLDAGIEVRIFTARVSEAPEDGLADYERAGITTVIQDWTELHVGRRLAVTCRKDFSMLELWDDRAIGVVKNTGETLADRAVREAARARGGRVVTLAQLLEADPIVSKSRRVVE